MSIKNTKAHFIGIGGIGMSALAELFHSMGAQVTGSDIKEGRPIEELRKKGIEVFIGHKSENISKTIDVVVYSSAIDHKNPEVIKTKKDKIPIIPRAEALAEIMRFKRGIAVGGTHGKTTTTSIISSIFMESNMDPTIAVGGRLKLIESTARLGQGPWMVAEADESDGSFSRLSPEISIITNIDYDHLDHFGSFENLQNAFLNFALNVPYYGCAIIFGDDKKTRELFSQFTKKVYFYGENSDNDYILKKEKGVYQVSHNSKIIGTFNLLVPGKHIALNALAACIATHQAGVDWDLCFKGANSYSGVDRRFQKIGLENNIRVYDDYAHHPTEITATIGGAIEMDEKAKIHLVYQPHRYTRTRDCWKDYIECFNGVSQLYLLDIYPAGEASIPGITSERLSQEVKLSAQYFSNRDQLVNQLCSQVKSGDVVLTMGAGDVWQLGPLILNQLKNNN